MEPAGASVNDKKVKVHQEATHLESMKIGLPPQPPPGEVLNQNPRSAVGKKWISCAFLVIRSWPSGGVFVAYGPKARVAKLVSCDGEQMPETLRKPP